jgi:glycosyltransferase involved in cell wall biosynthesis
MRAAPSGWWIQLLFRLGISRIRRKRYRNYCALSSLNKENQSASRLPDHLILKLWDHGIMMPSSKANGVEDIFLATTEWVPKKSKNRVGWIVHDVMQLRIPEYFETETNAFLKTVKSRAGRTDFIIANSQCTKEDLMHFIGYPEERICVIHPGVDLPNGAFKNEVPSLFLRPYVYYLGSLALNKNVDGMLRIFARCVHEHGLDMDIVLSGKDFCGRGFWDGVVHDLNIADRVHFTGWIPEVQREDILMNATMVWLFSWYEGFGLPVLEAAARGVPVLYTNRGAVPEILGNPDQAIDPSEEDEAAFRAAQALQSPQILAEWKMLGLKRAAQFSWEKSAAKLISWLESLGH